MAKKSLKDPSEGNKNIGRGIGVLLSNSGEQQKEKEVVPKFDTENVIPYSIRIPAGMFEKIKYEIAKEKKCSMRDVILEAIQQYYKLD